MCFKEWVYPEKKEISSELVKIAGSRVIAQLLVNRGIDTPEKISGFLDIESNKLSSPFIFQDMEKAVSRITQAIEKKSIY